MELQKLLREKGLEGLKKYHITHRRSNDFPNLVQFRYHHLESPMGKKVCQEARSCILDEENNWEVVARPFDKFFNYGDPLAAKVNWDSASVQDKLDGSLIVFFNYKGVWKPATSKRPDADCEINKHDITFSQLFWDTFEDNYHYKWLDLLDKDVCYMFELVSKYNKVVIKYEEPGLFLIGRRHRNGQELGIDEVDLSLCKTPFKTPRLFKFSSFADCLEVAKKIDGYKQEGFVIVDKYFNRIKIKSPTYRIYNKMWESICPKNIVEAIRLGNYEELKLRFPEWGKEIEYYCRLYNSLIGETEKVYEEIRKTGDTRKLFAEKGSKYSFSPALFWKLDHPEEEIEDYYMNIPLSRLMRRLKQFGG